MPREGRKVNRELLSIQEQDLRPGVCKHRDKKGPHCGGKKGANEEQQRHISVLLSIRIKHSLAGVV